MRNLEDILREYGPFLPIDRAREAILLNQGRKSHILTITVDDGEGGDSVYAGFVGHRLVNVDMIYESTKPMPEDLEIDDDNIWFGDDGFPS